jgi:hypothetical protein
MMTVDAATALAGLRCGVCHQRVRTGEAVLVAYRQGTPRVIHAHACAPPRAGDDRRQKR